MTSRALCPPHAAVVDIDARCEAIEAAACVWIEMGVEPDSWL